MQLLVKRIKNKTTAAQILWNKLMFSVLLLFHIYVRIISVTAKLTCHQCRGITCLRTSYEVTERCLNDLDICVNVFDGQTLMAQGCWEQLPEELRYKCDINTNIQSSQQLNECFKCNENLCNKMSSSSFECLQCDSDNDMNCLTNPLSLSPSRCAVSRTPNEYCFVKKEGERLIRGCSYNLQEQMSCLKSTYCLICQPSELNACNNIELKEDDNSSVGENADNEFEENLGQRHDRLCNQCNGISCLRNSYGTIQKCLNNVDICVTVFDDQTILAQGCWEQLPEEVRSKCDSHSQCLKCNKDLCNNFASETFKCLQCDSNNDGNCRTSPMDLVSSRCNISRTPNEYCFVKQEGERVIRGCSYTLEEQISCLSSDDCMICLPSEIKDCNNIEVVLDTNSGSGNGDDNGSSGDNNKTEGSEVVLPDDGHSNDGNSSPSTEVPNNNNGEGSNSSDNGNSNSSTEVPNNNGGEGNSDLENGGSESGSSNCRQIAANTFILVNIIIVFLVK